MTSSPVGATPLSAAIFGNRHLANVLATAAAIEAEHELVTTRRVASRTGLADSVVRAVLLRLVDAGVVEPTLREGGARGQQFYAIKATDLARSIVAAAQVVAGNESRQRSS
ncbi:MAG TPA: hypothetical protein VNQ77_07525 [Frankiaceae bacterium]|nr:hypothetical protein [Frankiaceae bacterium]